MFAITTAIAQSLLSATPKQRWENNKKAIESLKLGGNIADLALFNGWGSIPEVFSLNPEKGWAANAQAELKVLLGEEGYNSAAASILNAHYTSPEVISAMWRMVERLGFAGGRVLEPSCGTGMFFGLMPEDMRERSKLFGVEIDPIPAQIAQALYPKSRIYNYAFQDVKYPDGYFDLIIGNVPFGSYGVHDPKYNFLNTGIHNYFLAKSSDLVRIGGLVCILTSNYTLDARGSQDFREWLGGRQKMKLLAALHLPIGIFKQISRTEVSPLLLIFQKLALSEGTNSKDWAGTKEVLIKPHEWSDDNDSPQVEADLNQWFVGEFQGRRLDYGYSQLAKSTPYWATKKGYDDPHKLLGRPGVNKLYGNGFALYEDGRDVIAALDGFPLPAVYQPAEVIQEVLLVPPSLLSVKDGSLCLHEGKIYQRVGGSLQYTNVEQLRVKAFWQLREVLLQTIEAQQSGDDDTLLQCQADLATEYRHFTKEWGLVNSKENISKLGVDPNYFLVRSLEKSDKSLADIFYKRVCRTYSVGEVDNSKDALIHSLNSKGVLDLEFMSQISNIDKNELVRQLDAEDVIYWNPTDTQWELKADYLSGNIRQKLEAAKAAEITKNIQALEKVLPLAMLPDAPDHVKFLCLDNLGVKWDQLSDDERDKILGKKIYVTIGTSWIKPDIYTQFAREVLNIKVKITHTVAANTSFWSVDGQNTDKQQFGTEHLSSTQILSRGLNQQDPKVIIYNTDGSGVNYSLSAEATEEARGKLTIIKNAFKEWIWGDQQRCIELCTYYNTHINVYAERKFDGSYLHLPGSNPSIKLNPWQLSAIARILNNQRVMLAHDVGFGKTFIMITAVMECRRLGLARKPILVVQKGNVAQVVNDFKLLYPLANLLVPDKLDAGGRKLFTASILTGDFDCAIVTHPQFFTLSLSENYQVAFLKEQVNILTELIKDVDDRGTTKHLQRQIRNIENRIEKVTASHRKDNHIEFDGLTDFLLVDEIQAWKNLEVITKMYNVRGLPSGGSQRAIDSWMKALVVLGDLVGSANKVKGKLVGATGTILSNSMAELFTWMRMFQLPELKRLGIENFDEWASMFAEPTATAEITAGGKVRVITRFREFHNLQALRGVMSQFLDLVTNKTTNNGLKRPDAEFIDVVTPPSDTQLEFLREALSRAEAISKGMVPPDQDNMLSVTSDLVKCSLSPKLIGYNEEALDSKVHECIWNVWQIWQATTPIKGTQLIFSDGGTPKPDKYNVYQYIKNMLIALGIPDRQIAFIHDYDGQTKRAKLYRMIESGEIRIILGSTEKLGTGCNVHQRGIWAAHHLDAPWRPADLIQREGRSIRQGNGQLIGKILTKTWVFRYVVERLDALRWQTLHTKQQAFTQFLDGVELDSMEDVGSVDAYSYAQVKSLATGNPLLIEEANLRNQLNALIIQQRAHARQQLGIEYTLTDWQRRVEDTQARLKFLKDDLRLIHNINDVSNTEVAEINIAVTDFLENPLYENTYLGDYRGLEVYAKKWQSGAIDASLKGNLTYSLPWSYGKDRPLIKLSKVNPAGSFNSLIEELKFFQQILESNLETAKTEYDRAKSIKGQEFPRLEELNSIKQRLQEIDLLLAETAIIVEEEAKSSKANSDDEEENHRYYDFDDKSTVGNCDIDPAIAQHLLEREPVEEWLKEISEIVSKYSGFAEKIEPDDLPELELTSISSKQAAKRNRAKKVGKIEPNFKQLQLIVEPEELDPVLELSKAINGILELFDYRQESC